MIETLKSLSRRALQLMVVVGVAVSAKHAEAAQRGAGAFLRREGLSEAVLAEWKAAALKGLRPQM